MIVERRISISSLAHDNSKITFGFAYNHVENFKKLTQNLWLSSQLIQFPKVPGAWIALNYYKKWEKYGREIFFLSLESYLKKLPPKPNFSNFEFTGFGESTPYAVFAALEFFEKYQPEKKLILVSFGQPRMGNDIFTAFAQSRLEIFRVTLMDDWLPGIPVKGPRRFLRWSDESEIPLNSYPIPSEEFRHFKPEFWIEDEKTLNCNCPENNHPIVYKCFSTISYKEHPV
ncbi:hypothetical protein G9A89_006270 [Geosiphon pyriformis]|nr:hypothetical protein G9A89_006270 [Geosiphon pyriformis]